MILIKKKFNLLKKAGGYTLVELMVVVSIIGVATVSMIGAFQNNTRIERFNGNLKEFASHIREAQTESYSIATELCSGGPCNIYWRGAVLEYSQSEDSYRYYLLYGQDISITGLDQRLGISGKRLRSTYDLDGRGMVLERIESTAPGGSTESVGQVSLAFLAPDGRGYTTNQLVSSFNPTSQPYQQQNKVTLYVRDQATGLVGEVIFNSFNGAIETRIE